MHNIFVGSEVGLFKGVNTKTKKFENLNNIEEVSKEDGITALCWADADQEKVIMGQKNKVIKIYDCNQNKFEDSFSLDMGDGRLKTIAKKDGYLLTGMDSGIVKVWNSKCELNNELKVGDHLEVMRQNVDYPNQIATGGKNNGLKIWDLNRKNHLMFKSKNVSANYLDVRQPIWVRDIQFIPNSKKVVCGTAYHQVRLYDLSTSNKKPVIDMEFGENPVSSIAITPNPDQVVVGNNYGRMGLVDLRQKRLVHAFKKVAGSIRAIAVHPTLPLVVSACIDRFVRFHDLHRHTLTGRIYLKSKLTSLLLATVDPEKNSLFYDI